MSRKHKIYLLSESERVSLSLPTHSLIYSFSALLSALLRLTITITSISTCSEAIYCSCTRLIFIHKRRRLRRRCPDVPLPTNSFKKFLTNTSYVVIYLKTNHLTGFRALITRIRRYYQTVPRRAWMMWGIGVKKHLHLGRESWTYVDGLMSRLIYDSLRLRSNHDYESEWVRVSGTLVS